MATTRYGISFWADRVSARKRPSFPRHRGSLSVDVAIVGGGLAGCAIAYAFAAANVEVALFEADRIGWGSTSTGAGLFVPDPCVPFETIADQYGRKAARRVFQTSRRAALDLATTLRRLNVRAALEPRRSIVVATGYGDDKRLRREARARHDAGLDAVWLNARRVEAETGIQASAGLASEADGQIDPIRACFGFASAAAARGARLFERTQVRRVRARRKAVSIGTDGGDATARVVIIAANALDHDFRSLRRHFRELHTYMVATEPLPARVRRQVGRRSAVIRDLQDPPHYLGWLPDDRVLFGGGDQAAVADRVRPKFIVQRTGDLMYQLSRLYPDISGLMPEYGWDAPYLRSVDGLPIIGPHRNFPRHLFALGFGGVAHAHLASRALLRHYFDDTDKGDDVFAFNRLG